MPGAPRVKERRPDRRGRGVGGSSAINGQIAIRAIPEDFAWWVEEGCAGWGWEDVLPYFIKLEDDLDFGDKPYHGKGGPIPVWRPPLERWGHVDKALRTAAMDLGYGWNDDLTRRTQTGPHRTPSMLATISASPPTTATSNLSATDPTSP